MARQNGGNSASEQRESGRQQVVGVIRAAGEIARIDIAQEAGVSPATVTAITSELIRAGLIEEITPDEAPAASRRGRPRVALKLRGEAHRLAGLKVSVRSISIVLVDFEGRTIAEHEAPLSAPRLAPEALMGEIAEALSQAAAKAGLARDELSGLGVGLSGIIDAPRGFVHWSPSLTRHNVDFRDALEAMLGIPIFLDNDANLVAKAEQLFGEGRDARDFIVVTVEHGVGMGIVIDGAIYRGTRGCGAEFGHTKVHLDGALCRCGQRGCLEAYVADYALLREAAIAMPRDSGMGADARLEHLFEAARSSEPAARSILDRAARMFAMGLANLVNVFDPELIILSGEQIGHDFLYADEVIEAMKKEVVQIDVPPPEVRVHKWGDMMWAKGAAAFAMEGVTEMAVRRLASDA